MTQKNFILKVSGGDGGEDAYLMLPGHPKATVAGIVKKTESLRDFIKEYKGPDLYFDFDKDGTLIGIEVLS
ncbi:DUF2283 domain-containing protein [Microbulbifer discodermiae]|uniref:DUF2283 domain-containing protein n=1 Tax=Microbulbifer sp. 2201CG32-9 TaxID=3232309 RepID=UPI00345B6942